MAELMGINSSRQMLEFGAAQRRFIAVQTGEAGVLKSVEQAWKEPW